MSSSQHQTSGTSHPKKSTKIYRHQEYGGNFGSNYKPLSEIGSKDKNKIRRLKSQEISKLQEDTHVRKKASQNHYFKEEAAKKYPQDESLNKDDILPDSFDEI